MTSDRAAGFRSLEREVTAELPVEGDVPGWLAGSLIRNGPGTFAVGDDEVDHWFDGLAMLRKFSFDDGRVEYANRFLETDAYDRARRGRSVSGFATGSTSLLARIRMALFEDPYDNTNVIAERVGDRYVALTETPRRVAFDPETLETIGHVQYDGPAPNGQLACAHLQHDPWTGVTVNFEVGFGRRNAYHVFETRDPAERDHLATVEVREPAYMHSFALTRRYVVLTEFPFVVDPLDFLRPTNTDPFIDNFRWEPERGTRFIVVDRETREVVADPTTEALFGFHHVNAYERDDEVVVDLETVPDATSIGALYLDRLRGDAAFDLFAGKLDRFLVRPDEGTVEREELYEGGTALPTTSPAVRCREYRYAYAQGTEQPMRDWPTSVVKVDVRDGSTTEFEAGGYVTEPIFVPRPAEDAEDVGVVLAVVLEEGAERSALLVLDGETLAERARAPLPHPLPFDFHGRFFPEAR